MPGHEKHVVHNIQLMGKQFGLVVIRKLDVELSSHQTLTLSVNMKSSTNAIQNLWQSLKVFLPNINILPSNVCKVIWDLEQKDIIPSQLVSIPYCSISKAVNERGMCNLYYCICPSDLLGTTRDFVWLGGAWRAIESNTSSSLKRTVVITVGFDKN